MKTAAQARAELNQKTIEKHKALIDKIELNINEAIERGSTSFSTSHGFTIIRVPHAVERILINHGYKVENDSNGGVRISW